MSQSVELSSLDLRYEGHRLRDEAREARLLASIAQRGIEEPLDGVDAPEGRFLLDGFKRYRCAEKLGIGRSALRFAGRGGGDAAILSLMRASTDKALSILEQARFVVELLSIHGMSVAEVAETLSRSKGWVSMRRSLLDEMSPTIQQILFRGGFPVYSLHVHAAAVHAHELGSPEPDRAVHEGPRRQAAERAGHRAVGPGLLPRTGLAAGGHRRRQAGLVARADEARAGRLRRLQRVRASAAAGLRAAAASVLNG